MLSKYAMSNCRQNAGGYFPTLAQRHNFQSISHIAHNTRRGHNSIRYLSRNWLPRPKHKVKIWFLKWPVLAGQIGKVQDNRSEETKNWSSCKPKPRQAKANGFQLVNTTPEVVFLLLKTNVKDVFVIKDKNGILYKVGDVWIAEFYENDRLTTKTYLIKF